MTTPPVRVYHDWEFLDDGRTILPISVGMIADNGAEFYRVFNHTNAVDWERIRTHKWLSENVLPHLPITLNPDYLAPPRPIYDHPDLSTLVAPLWIPDEIEEFLHTAGNDQPVELWGYYSAYDHVLLAQQFGPLVEKPSVMPMRTNDLQQALDALDPVVAQHATTTADRARTGPEHHALTDARWNRDVHRFICDYQATSS